MKINYFASLLRDLSENKEQLLKHIRKLKNVEQLLDGMSRWHERWHVQMAGLHKHMSTAYLFYLPFDKVIANAKQYFLSTFSPILWAAIPRHEDCTNTRTRCINDSPA